MKKAAQPAPEDPDDDIDSLSRDEFMQRIYRKLADVKQLWSDCSPTCRRARRCALSGPNACFMVYRKDFDRLLREIVPWLRKQMGTPLYDPGPEVEVVSGHFDPLPQTKNPSPQRGEGAERARSAREAGEGGRRG